MSATYAIDEKKRRAQSEDLHETPKLMPPDEALKRLSTFKFPPKPGEGTEEVTRRLGEVVNAPESGSRAAPPDEELQHALFAHWQRRGDDQALISLFYAWRGAESLLELALAGPRFGVDARREPPWGVLVEGGTRAGGWTLKRLLMMLRALDPAVAERALARIKEGPFSLDERSSAAAIVEDRAWASALIDEWLALPPLTAAQAMDWDALALLGTTDDEARFRAFFAHAKDKLQWAGRNALLARAVGRLPAQTLVDVLVPFVEEGLAKKWKSSNVEPYFKALAHIHSPAVARALASWLGEKSIAKIATDYFRAHPDLTSAIEPVAKGKGMAAPVARAMLESIARTAPAEAEPKPKGKKTKKSKSAGENRGESAAGQPAVLVAPPWAAKKKVERPKLALEPIVENERYALPRKPYV
ncbi:MAG: hypothetical protein K8H88_34010, partial [Sandaracinaceae bacterium]|nr:hypothetical protein [Sandaracinaceae bacterium]